VRLDIDKFGMDLMK